MSLARSPKLAAVAKATCRELRRNSTAAEQLFWTRVRDRKFRGLKFYRQHPIFVDNDGRETFFVADFYCHEYRLAVAIDGKVHDDQKEHDKVRL